MVPYVESKVTNKKNILAVHHILLKQLNDNLLLLSETNELNLLIKIYIFPIFLMLLCVFNYYFKQCQQCQETLI